MNNNHIFFLNSCLPSLTRYEEDKILKPRRITDLHRGTRQTKTSCPIIRESRSHLSP